jgi:hypothetical protein
MINQKVQQLKSSFTVEGTPLFKSDRFTEAEIEQMKKDSTCHSSHWYGFGKNDKVWTDEEIATQIEAFFVTPYMSETQFKDIIHKMMKSLPLVNREHERKMFKELLYGILNWTEEKNGASEMWKKFGSAPCAPDGKFHGNKNLERYSKLYGACSMETIFEGQFSKKFHIFWYGANNALQEFETFWKEAKKKKDLAAQTFSSPYNTLEDLEDSVVVKKIKDEAVKFYLDKTKDFTERVRVFAVHGEEESCIFNPSDADLGKIFKIYMEKDWIQRHETVDCATIVESWLSNLKKNRCHLSWSNPYHPKLEKESRNYIPSEEAIDRLYKYYMEKLFLEGVGSFEFDW